MAAVQRPLLYCCAQLKRAEREALFWDDRRVTLARRGLASPSCGSAIGRGRQTETRRPLTKYIESAPAAWSQITIRHVLAHTAGFADFDTGDIGFSYRREYTNAEFVALLAAQPLRFEPGEQWSYTNAFPLLGMVIERASGRGA